VLAAVRLSLGGKHRDPNQEPLVLLTSKPALGDFYRAKPGLCFYEQNCTRISTFINCSSHPVIPAMRLESGATTGETVHHFAKKGDGRTTNEEARNSSRVVQVPSEDKRSEMVGLPGTTTIKWQPMLSLPLSRSSIWATWRPVKGPPPRLAAP
jgi:hypothetical protein